MRNTSPIGEPYGGIKHAWFPDHTLVEALGVPFNHGYQTFNDAMERYGWHTKHHWLSKHINGLKSIVIYCNGYNLKWQKVDHDGNTLLPYSSQVGICIVPQMDCTAQMLELRACVEHTPSGNVRYLIPQFDGSTMYLNNRDYKVLYWRLNLDPQTFVHL